VRVSQLRNVEVQDLLGRERVELETNNIRQLVRGRVVLDMGKPIRIVDLARQMIELSGLRPHTDIKIEFTGVRPGEKLFEELSHKQENLVPTGHVKISRFISEPVCLEDIRGGLDRLRDQLHSEDANAFKLLLHDCVPDYSPWLGSGGEPARQPALEPESVPVAEERLPAAATFSER